MPSPRALFVKLSSLGDVVHHFPAVTDLNRHRPEIVIEWAVEEAYAPLVRLHPAVNRAIPVALRRLRSGPLAAASWAAMAGARRDLAKHPYDWIVDSQGLLKSVAIARLAKGPLFGYERNSIRERSAARFCDVGICVPRRLHAVERNRRLVAGVFGYAVDGPADYGLSVPEDSPGWLPDGDYVVALHASSRQQKSWPESQWVSLGARLHATGLAVVYPGGTTREREAAARLARATPGAVTAPAMTLREVASLLARANAVVGVDTGLTHLAVAFGTPTVGIYVATQPGLTGLLGGARAVNLGGPGQPPAADEVARVLIGGAGPP